MSDPESYSSYEDLERLIHYGEISKLRNRYGSKRSDSDRPLKSDFPTDVARVPESYSDEDLLSQRYFLLI